MDFVGKLTEEKIVQYRTILDGIDIPTSKKDEMIMRVHSMMKAFVDTAFGEDAVQIVMGKRIKDSFQDAVIDVKRLEIETVDQRRVCSAGEIDPDLGGENSNKHEDRGFEP